MQARATRSVRMRRAAGRCSRSFAHACNEARRALSALSLATVGRSTRAGQRESALRTGVATTRALRGGRAEQVEQTRQSV